MEHDDTPPLLRYFGRCPVKGCKTKRVLRPDAPGTHTWHDARTMAILDSVDGEPRWPLHELGERKQNASFRAAGLACPEHDRVIFFKKGRFTYNPEKVCDGRCMNAVGPSCECSCKGENHGGTWS